MLKIYEEKLSEITNEVCDIAQGLLLANEQILNSLAECDKEGFANSKTYIKNISQKTNEIDHSIITTLALHNPEAKDLRKMVAYLKITNELLRATSSTRSFVTKFMNVCNELDIDTINQYAIPMQKATIDALKNTYAMITIDCVDEVQEHFNRVLISESKTDDLYEMIENKLLLESKENGIDFSKYHGMLSALRKSEKIADRALSVASLILFANVGGDIHHS